MPTPSRVPALDGLRGLAAGAVLIGHAVAVALPPARLDLPGTLAHAGVVAFLLASGAVIPNALERAGSLTRFWRGRAYRLLPLYWACIALLALLTLAGLARDYADVAFTVNYQAPPIVWLVNLTMLQGFVGVPHLLGPFWTLHLELQWYAVASLLWATGAARYSRAVLLGLCALAPFGDVPLYLCLFWAGHVATRRPGAHWAPLLVAALCVVAGGDLMAGRLLGLALAWPAVTGRLPWLARLARGGEISYGVYLLHPLVIVALPLAGPLALPVWVVATVALAAVAWRYVEVRGIAAGRR
jgi:peptidoglycan/LPS O-acetylase OafA/YrhL